MISEALKPNVQDLQTDVIDLLGQISSLMERARTALSSDSTSEKYADFQQEVADAAHNVEKLELMMTIVAPMKAGKSTIINAIVGQEYTTFWRRSGLMRASVHGVGKIEAGLSDFYAR